MPDISNLYSRVRPSPFYKSERGLPSGVFQSEGVLIKGSPWQAPSVFTFVCLCVFSQVGRQRPTLTAHPGRPPGCPSSTLSQGSHQFFNFEFCERSIASRHRRVVFPNPLMCSVGSVGSGLVVVESPPPHTKKKKKENSRGQNEPIGFVTSN